MRILVTGGRTYLSWAVVRRVLLEYCWDRPITIVHGACRTGADRVADEVAEELGYSREPVPADWSGPCDSTCRPGHRRQRPDGTEFCPAAGPRRNQVMVDKGADVCIAFPGGTGTTDCVSRARAAGIPVRMVSDLCPAFCTSAPVAAPSAAAISGSRRPGSSSSTGGRPTVPARKPSHRRGRTR